MRERLSAHADAKRAIGHAAAKLIEDGDLIIFDSGSTTEQIAGGTRQPSRLRDHQRADGGQPTGLQRSGGGDNMPGGALRGFNATITGPTSRCSTLVHATYAFAAPTPSTRCGASPRTYARRRG
ncbi:MAG: hypothetical protein R2719_13745 [Micropruina sp.]